MSRVLLALALLTAAATVSAIGPAAGPATPAATQPVPGMLLGVAGTSSADVWAVGTTPATTLPGRTLTEHWNGVRWRVVPSVSPGTGKGRDSVLSGVAAVSRTDVWAVGSYSSGPHVLNPTTFGLIEHWNGKRWTRLPCPCSHSQIGVPALAGIAAVSRSDIWAVGSGVARPLIVHWNGKKWVRQFLPGNAEYELTAVSATSAHNAWAVGTDVANEHALTAHWNGKKWSYVRSPNPGRFNELRGVTAISRSDVWAVGQNEVKDVKIERWNGSMWSLVADPHVTGQLSVFNAISAAPHGGLWAVGKKTTTNSLPFDKTLTAHWTGTRWIAVPDPDLGSTASILYGVYAASKHSVWAVGVSGLNALIEHWNGKKWHLITP